MRSLHSPCCVGLALFFSCLTVLGQSSESYSLHAHAFTSGGGAGTSEAYRAHDHVAGQCGIGKAGGAEFSVRLQFANNQVFDFSRSTSKRSLRCAKP